MGPVLGEVVGADAAQLFVVGEEEHERLPEPRRVGHHQPVHGEGEEALHVGRAAPDEATVLLHQLEGIRAPLRFLRRYHIHVTREDQSVAGGRVDRRARFDDQVGLGAVGRVLALDPDPGPVHHLADEIRDREVAVPAHRVEPDQATQDFGAVKGGWHGLSLPVSGGAGKWYAGRWPHRAGASTRGSRRGSPTVSVPTWRCRCPGRGYASEPVPRSRSPIRRSPDVLGGKPVFAGSTVPVEALLDSVRKGEALERFLERHAELTRDQVTSVLAYALGELIERERIPPVPSQGSLLPRVDERGVIVNAADLQARPGGGQEGVVPGLPVARVQDVAGGVGRARGAQMFRRDGERPRAAESGIQTAVWRAVSESLNAAQSAKRKEHRAQSTEHRAQSTGTQHLAPQPGTRNPEPHLMSRRTSSILLALLVVAVVLWVATPVFLIMPFKSQTPAVLALSLFPALLGALGDRDRVGPRSGAGLPALAAGSWPLAAHCLADRPRPRHGRNVVRPAEPFRVDVHAAHRSRRTCAARRPISSTRVTWSSAWS